MTAAIPEEALGRPVEIWFTWFTDEARVGQQCTLTRAWLGEAWLASPRPA